MHVAGGVVVGVKEVGVLRHLRLVTGQENFQDEGLKKPAGMREMPFGRADVGHRLHDEIFRLQRFAKTMRKLPDLPVARQHPQLPGCSPADEVHSTQPVPVRRRRSLVCAFLLQFVAPRFDHLIVSRLLDSACDELFPKVPFLFETVVRHLMTGGPENVVAFSSFVADFVRRFWRVIASTPVSSFFACAQSASVNSSGLRSSIIAISRARFSTISGEGTPRPFPCRVIFPCGDCDRSFISSYSFGGCRMVRRFPRVGVQRSAELFLPHAP